MGKTYPEVVRLLKREFEEKKVSKYSFCKKTGINPTSVERYLHGISEPTQASLEKLAKYFEVSVPFLRGDKCSALLPPEMSIAEKISEIFVEGFKGKEDDFDKMKKMMLLFSKVIVLAVNSNAPNIDFNQKLIDGCEKIISELQRQDNSIDPEVLRRALYEVFELETKND